jgi:hypothetical protein
MKKELIQNIAKQLKSYGYKVYIAKNGEYGFYTEGVKVVSFGGSWCFSVDFSGNYSSKEMRQTGTGWQIAKDMGVITKEQAEQFIKTGAPHWATSGIPVKYTTPEQYLKMYGSSSGYVEFTGE